MHAEAVWMEKLGIQAESTSLKANCIGSAHSHIDWQNQGEKIRTIRETETDVGYGNMTRPGGRPMADVYRFCVCSR
jgi:hypothetical protein